LAVLALCAITPAVASAQGQRGNRVSIERPQIDTTFAFNASGAISIDIAAGELRVTTWTRSEVRINATITRGQISARLSQNRIELETELMRGTPGGPARIELTVPVGVSVSANSHAANVVINGTRGDVRVETASGTVEVNEAAGRTDIEASAAKVTLQRVKGNTSVAVISGSIAISEIEGDLTIETTSAPATVERANLQRLHFESTIGGLDFSGTLATGARHQVETHSGRLSLRFPPTFGATIELETFSGELRPGDVAVTVRSGEGRGRDNERMLFSINGGGARIAVSTFSGDIYLYKIGSTTPQ
jgi:hypothetical protein